MGDKAKDLNIISEYDGNPETLVDYFECKILL